jgi:hypothetical protein
LNEIGQNESKSHGFVVCNLLIFKEADRLC